MSKRLLSFMLILALLLTDVCGIGFGVLAEETVQAATESAPVIEAEAPVVTPVPATPTPVPATPTPVQATATPEPATATPVPATATPEPATATPVPATATPEPEVVTPEPVVVTLEPIVEVTPEPVVVTPEPIVEVTPEPVVETPAPAAEATPVPAATPVDDTDYAHNLTYSPKFTSGYVKVANRSEVFASENAGENFATVSGGVVYAIKRSGDIVRIAYFANDELHTAYVSAENLTPMTADAVAAYKAKRADDAAYTCYYKDELPVDSLTETLKVVAAEPEVTPEPEAIEEPEVTEPETVEPEATVESETIEPEVTEPEATTESEVTEPEATVEPETTEPETTEPETTEPEATEPETTEPEATEPETVEPEATEPVTVEPEATEPETIEEPETTEPETVESETTEPEATVESEATVEPETTEPEAAEAAEEPEIVIVPGKTEEGSVEAITEMDARTPVNPAFMSVYACESLGVGDSANLLVWAYNAEGGEVTVNYTLSVDVPSRAYIDENNYIHALAEGEVTVTAVAENGVAASTTFEIVPEPSSITLANDALIIGLGDYAVIDYTLSAGSAAGLTFYTENGGVAYTDSIEIDGEWKNIVRGVFPGTTVLTVRTYNGMEAQCAVTVLLKPSVVNLSAETLTVKEGETVTLSATFGAYEIGTAVFYQEDSEDDADGEVAITDEGDNTVSITGLRSGTRTVCVKAGDNAYAYAECEVTVIPDAVTIDIPEVPAKIGTGETITLNPVAYDGRGNVVETTFTYASSAKYAAIKNGNQLYGSSAGTAKLTVKAANGASTVLPVTVAKAPASIKLNPASGTLAVGQGAQLSYTLSTGSASRIKWTSSNPAVAAVDENGYVTAISAGTATIQATTFKTTVKAICTVTVKNRPESISLDKNQYILQEGLTVKPVVSFTPADALGVVEYSLNTEGVATVSETGVITGIDAGLCKLTATSYDKDGNEISASAMIFVTRAAVAIENVESAYRVGLGDTITINPVSVSAYGSGVPVKYTVTSSAVKYVPVPAVLYAENEVDCAMVITGKAAGTAKLTIKTDNGVPKVITVTVTKAPDKIVLSKSSMTLCVGQTAKNAYKISNGGASDITWSSSDASVANVDYDGTVIAAAPGEATITLKTYNNITASFKVIVKAAPTAVSLTESEYAVKENGTIALSAVMTPEDAYGIVEYEVRLDDEEVVAEVSGSTLKGLLSGDATVIAKVWSYADEAWIESNPAPLTVEPAAVKVAFTANRTSIGLNEYVDLKPVAYDARGNEIETAFTIKSSGSAVKVPDNSGIVLGYAKGSAKLTLTADGASTVVTWKVVAAPTTLNISAAALRMNVGSEEVLTAWTVAGEDANIVWTSSDPETVTVDENGVVRGAAEGTATITAALKYYPAVKKQCTVTVYPFPESITYEASEIEVDEGQTVTVALKMLPEGSWAKPEFTVFNNGFAEVDVDGRLTGLKAGSTAIIAWVTNPVSGVEVIAECALEVTVNPGVVEIYEDKLTTPIGVGEIRTLDPVGLDGYGQDIDCGSITVATSNEAIVAVVNGNQVKGVKAGTAVVRLTAENGRYTDYTVTVKTAPTAVKLESAALVMQVNEVYQMTAAVAANQATSFKWTSSDDSVVSVGEDGCLTAHEEGKATITVATHNGKKATCAVTVKANPEFIDFDVASINIVKGASTVITANVYPEGAYDVVSYSSSDETVATVDAATGKVTAVGAGTAVIRAAVVDVLHDCVNEGYYDVHVSESINCFTFGAINEPVEELEDNVNIVAGIKEYIDLDPVAYNDDFDKIITGWSYKSSATAKVKVVGTRLQAVAAGTSVITVTPIGGEARTVTVTVKPAPTKVTLSPASLTMAVGSGEWLEAVLLSGQGGSVTWESSNPEVAAVYGNGYISAVAPGTAVICAATFNGKYAYCTVTVKENPTSIRAAEDTITVYEGETITPELVFEPADSYAEVYFEFIPDDGDAHVNEDGTLTGGLSGTGTLVYTAYNYEGEYELRGECFVEILPAPVTLSIAETRTVIGKGESIDIIPVAYDAHGNVVETVFTLKTAKAATIAVSGTMIRGVAAGSTTITAIAANGVSVSKAYKVVNAPTKVTISRTTATMNVYGALKLMAYANNATTSPITWTSSDESVAVVSATGLVTATGEGKAIITASDYTGKAKATCTVTVQPEACEILGFTVGSSADMVEGFTLGEGASMSVKAVLPEGTLSDIVYASDNPFIASVNRTTGKVTAKGQGDAVITATIYNRGADYYITEAIMVYVSPAPVTVKIDLERTKVGVGEVLPINAAAYDSEGNWTGSTFTFTSSSSAGLATSAGAVKGVKTGTYTVTATAYNGVKSAPVTITVVAAPTAISVQGSVKLIAGESVKPVITLTPAAAVSSLTWLVNPETPFVEISKDGVITGISASTVPAQVKVTTYNGKSCVFNVYVYNEPTELILKDGETDITGRGFTLGAGDSRTLSYAFDEGAWDTVEWKSSESSVATVVNGKVVAVAEGETTISVTSAHGLSASCTVNVKPAPSAIRLKKSSITISVGETFDVFNLVELPEGTAATLSITKLSTTSYLQYSGMLIRGKAASTAKTTVTISTHNGKTAALTVIVAKKPAAIGIKASSSAIYVGDSVTFSPVFQSGCGGSVTFVSSDESVIKVNSDGTAIATGKGEANVTVTLLCDNSITKTIPVTVRQHVECVEIKDDAIVISGSEEKTLTITHYDDHPLGVLVTPENADDQSVTWMSDDTSKVTVDANGVINGKNITATPVKVTCTSNDGSICDYVLVTVQPVAVEGVSLNWASSGVERGRTFQLEATITPENADNKKVTWTSSDDSIAKVDQNGLVTAVADSGEATITCTTEDGGYTKTCTIYPSKVFLESVDSDINDLVLTHYDVQEIAVTLNPIDADIASWTITSSNTDFATVEKLESTEKGVLRAKITAAGVTGENDCTITITAEQAYNEEQEVVFTASKVISLTVNPVKVTGLELPEYETNVVMRVKQEFNITPRVTPDNADDQDIWFESTSSEVADVEVDEDGNYFIASGETAGSAAITIETNDGGYTKTINVTVYDDVSVEIKSNYAKNTVGNTIEWTINTENVIGRVGYADVTVLLDGEKVGIELSGNVVKVKNIQEGTYTLHVVVADSADEQSAEDTDEVEVASCFETTVANVQYTYKICETRDGQEGIAVKCADAGTKTSISIPATIDNAPVVRIDTEAFMNNTTLKSIELPDTVTEIGARAFKGCTALTTMTSSSN